MFIPNPEFPDATDDQMWEQVRLWRDVQLAQSDWTQLPDVSTNKTAWAQYRQALRDITKSADVKNLPIINPPDK